MAQDQKRELIIKAAQTRFAHFGVSKTTMTEIADDVSMSKASLYYYFPDKLGLYAAVIQSIIEIDEKDIKLFSQETDPSIAVPLYLEARTRFVIQNYNILEYLRNLHDSIPEELKSVFLAARTREVEILTGIVERGYNAGLVVVDDAKNIAELFYFSLEGLRMSVIKQRANFFPDKKQFEAILKREQQLAAIFFRGLAC